jgi:hypothetical protein
MAATPSRSPAAGGDKEDACAGAGSGDEGRGRRQERLQRRNLASRRQTRAPGRRKRRWSKRRTSGRERREPATAMLVGNVVFFFILRNGETIKLKGNKSIGLVVHRPGSAASGWSDVCTVAFPFKKNHMATSSRVLN